MEEGWGTEGVREGVRVGVRVAGKAERLEEEDSD